MVRPLEAHVEVAKRLLAQERGGGGDAKERAVAAGRVYETLFRALAPVIGAAGVRALFARSVRLASTEFPCLGEISMTAEPPEDSVQVAEQLVGCLSKLEPAAGSEVATGLYAVFLGLLAKFIGERLVSQIVTTAFPAIAEADTGTKELK